MTWTAEEGNRSLWARMASRTVRSRADLVVVVLDLVLIAVAFASMMVLRFDGSVPNDYWSSLTWFIPLAMVIGVASNWFWGLYGQLWRHASIYEARRLLMSGTTLMVAVVLIEVVTPKIPVSVVLTGAVLATFLMALVRFESRLFSFRRQATHPGLGVVVVGAGDAGASLVADMLRSPRAGFHPVAVLDDDTERHGRSFMGVRVAGGIDDLPEVVETTGANLVVFAMTNAPQDVVRRAASGAEAADVAMKIVPGMSTAMRGGVSLRDIRDVRIEDLLGREQIVTDLDAVGEMLAGKRVLITGAGGSIGSEIARQVARSEPRRLLLLDHDETHLHDVANELDGPVVQVLADIRNRRQIFDVFAQHRPDVVFHAAAHKHVPLLEAHPCEAVATNVLGSENVLDACTEFGVQRMVAISTDKAVYPSSVMGATKRLAEQLVLSRAPRHSAYCAVRFGNVLGSRGSVVPTFMKQIEAGGPVTVTDPRMTRFFMSIEEAVQLVLQAAALADSESGGEVFMLDMGEPVPIIKLAERMIRLSGRQPGTDIEIKITGTRPGEKLAEELKTLEESETPTVHPSVTRVTTQLIPQHMLDSGVRELESLVQELRDDECATVLRFMAMSEPGAARVSVQRYDGAIQLRLPDPWSSVIDAAS
jgi:FlaA1/EpsC-like NDP-sugar epimerase